MSKGFQKEVDIFRRLALICSRRMEICIAVATVLAATIAPSGSVQAQVVWVLNEEAVSLGITGASPHVERIGSVDRVWHPSLAGTIVDDCTDAGSCSSVPITGRLGADFTAVTLPNGKRRAYFIDPGPGTSSLSVYSAACATSACLSVGTSVLTTSDLTVPSNTRAWGVPDAVVTPDGKVRLYVVESPTVGDCSGKNCELYLE